MISCRWWGIIWKEAIILIIINFRTVVILQYSSFISLKGWTPFDITYAVRFRNVDYFKSKLGNSFRNLVLKQQPGFFISLCKVKKSSLAILPIMFGYCLNFSIIFVISIKVFYWIVLNFTISSSRTM